MTTTTSMLPDIGIELREGYAEVGDVNLHYVEVGDQRDHQAQDRTNHAA